MVVLVVWEGEWKKELEYEIAEDVNKVEMIAFYLLHASGHTQQTGSKGAEYRQSGHTATAGQIASCSMS